MQKNGVGEDYLRTELEPLGQEIQPIKPDEEFPTGVTASTFSADSPEWLCQNLNQDEYQMPIGCQRAKNEKLNDYEIIKTPKEGDLKWIVKIKSDPNKSPWASDVRELKFNLRWREGANSTTKQSNDTVIGGVNETVDVKILFDDEIFSEFKDASESGQKDGILGKPPEVGGASPSLKKRFASAWEEMARRLPNPKCAAIFGGIDKVKKALNQDDENGTFFQIKYFINNKIAAESSGTLININPNGMFMAQNQMYNPTDKQDEKVLFPYGEIYKKHSRGKYDVPFDETVNEVRVTSNLSFVSDE